MSTHKSIDRICCFAVALALVITAVFCSGEALGIQTQARQMGYESTLFDNSYVHTIDILIDDWDAFLSTCQSESYTLCDLVIDGEAVSSVGIRGKGNTSLSTVSSMDSDRYSFKIEFDQYTSAGNYHGLDKLSLNNLIQDNTMMKDYLVYQMMNEFGAAAPLCSFVYITVNGEDWGLYLAVEGVEDSFLQRNYGTDYGDLYKPDSMSMGGGRGNGRDFDISDFLSDDSGTSGASDGDTAESGRTFDPSDAGRGQGGGFDPSAMGQGQMPGNFGPSTSNSEQASDATVPSIPAGEQATEGFDPSTMTPGEVPSDFDPSQLFGQGGMDFSDKDFGGMSFGMGSSDVKLQYIDDDPDSYSNIFSSAKTDVTAADQTRLIESLKTLSSGEDAADAVDVESVIRYFVVHNFVVNGDSYTGSMIHNYYLYEEDGLLAMIPWDYNLAFGTFQGGTADSAVNDDIDSPLSVTGSGDRPMADWIFASEEYTALYHQYFTEFLDTVDIAAIINDAYTLIAPYVEKDPTKFCTYEEFELGVSTLRSFCALRTQSVRAQLSGEDAAVDASAINLSDMGTMNMGGGMGRTQGGMDRTGSRGGNASQDQTAGTVTGTSATTQDQAFPGGMQMPGQGSIAQVPGTAQTSDGSTEMTLPEGMTMPEGMTIPEGMELPEGMTLPEGMKGMDFSSGGFGQGGSTAGGSGSLIVLGVSVLFLAAGLIFAFKYRR